MTRYGFLFTFLLILLALIAPGAIASENSSSGVAEEGAQQKSAQQKGMEDNLQGSMPMADLQEQQNQGDLENPRLVIQENLKESPDVRVISASDQDGQLESEESQQDDSLEKKTKEELEQFEQQLETEGADKGKLLFEKTDKFMELSRRPLTYFQEHLPFLTKRNVIFFGRLELDGAMYGDGVLDEDDGFNMRRFRLGLAGPVIAWPGWNYKLEVDLTDGENTLSDAYLSWRFKKWGTIRIGNQKVAQTLAGQTSSLSISFMERPLPVLAFTLQRRIGIGWDTHLRKLGANITLFTSDPNEGVGSQGWAARGYFNPSRNKFHVIHVGGSVMQLTSESDAQLRARPESHVTNTRLVDTGVWADVDVASALGLELAGARGPFTFKSEFYRTEWSRNDENDPIFKGWYGEVSWFLTGELALYRDGKFIRPNISGKNGAWELAFRFSSINLNDADVQGGTQKNLSFGVSWYSKTHWRFMANVIKVNAEDGPYGEQKPWIAQLRAQYYF
jgi:phosphate-selective porin OprO/OprP